MTKHKSIRHLVAGFTPVDGRLAIIRARFFFNRLIWAPTTEERAEECKYTFYELLELAYGRCPGHDINIVLGDFNAKVGRESFFAPTRLKHRNIHKATWLSPDAKTRNQIDLLVIDGRYASSVRALLRPNANSDHHVVAAKVCTRLVAAKRAIKSRKKFNVGKLHLKQIANLDSLTKAGENKIG